MQHVASNSSSTPLFSSFHFSQAPVLADNSKETEILAAFPAEQQSILTERLKILAAIAAFVSRDYQMPVTLNLPGKGWHFDYTAKTIRVDPLDLLNKPLDFLRFVIAHEAAHRRIGYLGKLSWEDRNSLGYLFLTNSIEDPRINNYITKGFKRFEGYLDKLSTALDLFEKRSVDRAMQELGHVPDFLIAGFEYIRAWLEITTKKASEKNFSISTAVEQVIAESLKPAIFAWNSYPLTEELENDSSLAEQYSEQARRTIKQEIWPIFKRLLEADTDEQQLQKFIRKFSREQGLEKKIIDPENEWEEMRDLWDPNLEKELSDESKKRLKELMTNGELSRTNQNADAPFDLSKLTPELKKELQQLLESLKSASKEKFKTRAIDQLKEFERGLISDLATALAKTNTGSGSDLEESATKVSGTHLPNPASGPDRPDQAEPLIEPEATRSGANRYFHTKRILAAEISQLEQNLKRIFRDKRASKKAALHNSGQTIALPKRIRESAREISPVKTKSFERVSALVQRDYAITILVDLSGSMSINNKINEAFKGLLMILEPLMKLGVKVEVFGYNSKLYQYKRFREKLSLKRQASIGSMVEETSTASANYSDDGWAIAKTSARLMQCAAKRKFLIVLTDGLTNASTNHNSLRYRINTVIERIRRHTNQIIIGLGIGEGTDFVKTIYPNSIANIRPKDLPGEMTKLLEDLLHGKRRFKQ